MKALQEIVQNILEHLPEHTSNVVNANQIPEGVLVSTANLLRSDQYLLQEHITDEEVNLVMASLYLKALTPFIQKNLEGYINKLALEGE